MVLVSVSLVSVLVLVSKSLVVVLVLVLVLKSLVVVLVSKSPVLFLVLESHFCYWSCTLDLWQFVADPGVLHLVLVLNLKFHCGKLIHIMIAHYSKLIGQTAKDAMILLTNTTAACASI